MNEQQEFKIGDDEEPATVEMNDDGSNAVITTMEETPLVEVEQQQAKPKKDELDQYSDKVQRRIDKLTSRLRETQRREEAAVEYARNAHNKAEELERRFQQTDADRLTEAKSRVETQVVALKQIIKKAREEYDIDTETEAQQRLTSMVMDQQRISEATAYRQQTMARQAAPQPQYQQPQQQQRQQQQHIGIHIDAAMVSQNLQAEHIRCILRPYDLRPTERAAELGEVNINQRLNCIPPRARFRITIYPKYNLVRFLHLLRPLYCHVVQE